jgi:hypothetical protein
MNRITIKKSVDIHAAKANVWDVLINDKFTRIWYAEFSDGAHAQTDWQVGSKTLFIDNTNNGLIGKVIANKPNELISIEFSGEVRNGIEDYDGESAQAIKGGLESYRLSEKNGITHLQIEADLTEDFATLMSVAWENALQKIKSLSETSTLTTA